MGNVYDITIAAAGLGGAAPADGFIDNKTSYGYMDTSGDAPDTLANAKAKMRANRRFKNVIMQLHAMTNCYLVSVTKTGGTADTAPTQIVLRVDVEHGDDALKTFDIENAPTTLLTGAAALERCVARALIISETRNSEFYDPTVVAGRDIDGDANAGTARGTVLNIETIGALAANIAAAEAAITVVKVS